MTHDFPALDGAGDLVAVLSSDTDLELLQATVSGLPRDLAAPLLIIHSSSQPAPLEHVGRLLQPVAPLPIAEIRPGQQPEPGMISLVALDRRHVLHEGQGQIDLSQPLDSLLSALAGRYGERLILVALYDLISEGLAGALEVRGAGGTVIMPPEAALGTLTHAPLPPNLIEFERQTVEIGPLIHDLLRRTEPQPNDVQANDLLQLILEQISRQANIDFRPYKTSTMLRRIGRRMVVTHQRSMEDYLDFLKDHPAEVGELVQAFLINVTQFFRDAEAFAYLRDEILPALINQTRQRDRVLRFWSAGCATGEEPYSLAMLLADLLGAELPEWSIKIFATDLDEAAISFARMGLYPENLLRNTPGHYRERFFERTEQGYRISKTLRQMVIFGHQDLSRSAPFPRINLVMCRNVLIYFTPDLQDYVLSQFAFSLSASNGFLFLGKAEIIRPMHSYYEIINKQWKVYRRTDEVVPVPRRQGMLDAYVPRVRDRRFNPAARAETQSSAEPGGGAGMDLSQLRRFNELLLRFLPVGVVVIDRSYRLLTANAAARRLLGLREVSSELDFLHAVRGIPYAEVRNGIDAVFRDRNPVTLSEVELNAVNGGNGRYLLLTIVPIQMDAALPDLAAMSISDVTEQVQTRQHLEAAQAEQTQLLSELGSANKRLSDLNKELMDANEELQVANEEMMLTYEELQATNEEFEATNEELQATNEELETNNEELQATNEELQTTNEELRARTAEMQELTAVLESERGRLAEIVELAPFYIMVLYGPRLLIEVFNPRYARLAEGRKIANRPLEDVAELFWKDRGLVELAQQVYQSDRTLSSPELIGYVPNERGELLERVFRYTMVPTHDVSGQVLGVVVYGIEE
ncbi:MAG TPA: CheR family methyltransferase, partial [Herpetosiphonaceae bacterium]